MAAHTHFSGSFLRVDVELDSVEKFYILVNWMNTNAGVGKVNWTATGRIKRQIIKNGRHLMPLVVTSIDVTHEQVLDFIETI